MSKLFCCRLEFIYQVVRSVKFVHTWHLQSLSKFSFSCDFTFNAPTSFLKYLVSIRKLLRYMTYMYNTTITHYSDSKMIMAFMVFLLKRKFFTSKWGPQSLVHMMCVDNPSLSKAGNITVPASAMAILLHTRPHVSRTLFIITELLRS